MAPVAIILLPLAGCFAAIFMRLRKIRLAYVWLSLVTGVFLSWLFLVFATIENQQVFTTQNMLSLYGQDLKFAIGVSVKNWSVLLLITSTLLAYLLTDITTLDGDNSLKDWIFTAVIMLVSMLTILSANYWVIILGWTLLDLVELVITGSYKREESKFNKNHLLSKLLGSILFVFIASNLQAQFGPGLFENIRNSYQGLLIICVLFRSGIFTYHNLLGDIKEGDTHPPIQVLPLFSVLTSLFLLVHVPAIVINPIPGALMKVGVFALIAFIAVIDFSSREMRMGRYVQLPIFTGIVIFSFLTGLLTENPIILILPLFPYFWENLSTHSSKNLRIFRILIYILLCMAPLSMPVDFSLNNLDLLRIVDSAALVIVFGFLIARQFFKRDSDLPDIGSLEPWFQFFYIGGFLILLSSAVLILLKNTGSPADFFQSWWVSVGLITFAAVFYFLLNRSDEKVRSLKVQPGERLLKEISEKNILTKIAEPLMAIFSGLFHFSTGLFEGGGGILWAVTILALFLTLLSIQGGF